MRSQQAGRSKLIRTRAVLGNRWTYKGKEARVGKQTRFPTLCAKYAKRGTNTRIDCILQLIFSAETYVAG
jgi:hypothetical protein